MIGEFRKDQSLSDTKNKRACCKNRVHSSEMRELRGDDFYFLCEVGSNDDC